MSRQVVMRVAAAAGAPAPIMRAWHTIMDRMVTHNALADTIGVGYTRPASIPQGCPLSMALLSIVVRPLLLMIKACGAIPRSLADDIFAHSKGPGHWRRVRAANNMTHVYLSDAASQISHSKCSLFSTCPL
eukprot:15484901-Alexandrium_andersonii.AAC.1